MYLELTYRCTCRCKFCERWKIGPKLAANELTTGEVKKVLTDAYRLGVRYVGFTGGEVFLRKDIFKIGRFAKKLGLSVTVASNGTLIDEGKAKKIAENFASVTISIDGIKRETHDFIRGVKGTYDLAMRAIDLLEKNHVPIAVNLVITKRNILEVDRYIEYFSARKIYFQLTPVHQYEAGYFSVDKELKNINLKKFQEEWGRLSRKYNFLNNYFYKHVPAFLSSPGKLLDAYTCFAGAVMFFLNPYGEVFPCEFKRTSMGNIRKNSLLSIWERAKQMRQTIASNQRGCICWTHCTVPLNNRLTKFICLKNIVN